MKSRTLIVAGLAAFVWQAPAWAQESVDDRLSGLERRIKYLEQRVAAQDEMIVEKNRQIAELTGREDAWFDAVEIGGVIELEAAYASHGADDDPYEGDPSTTAELATLELGIAARIHDWVGAEIVVKNDDEDDIAIDETFLTIAPLEGTWALQTGRYVVPFGVYETNMISDPVTLELGETGQDAVMFAAESGGLYGSAFAFDGDLERGGDNTIDGFGVALGYAMEIERGGAIDANLSWINDLGESGGVNGVIDELVEENAIEEPGADNRAGLGRERRAGLGRRHVDRRVSDGAGRLRGRRDRIRRCRRRTLGLDGRGRPRVRPRRQGCDGRRRLSGNQRSDRAGNCPKIVHSSGFRSRWRRASPCPPNGSATKITARRRAGPARAPTPSPSSLAAEF